MPIKILVDSASDIVQEEAIKLGVELLPMHITIGEDEYLDGVDLLPHDFYEKLTTSKDLPKTSQINPYRFEKAFERLIKEGYDVIAITLSSKLSNTYNNAVQASSKFPGKVYVVDSLNACTGEKLLCQYAVDLVNKGLKIEDIVYKLNEDKAKINVYAVIDTLEFLKRGGRISKATAFAGELLSIKPIISVTNGEIKVVGKARGTKKAHILLKNIVIDKGGINLDMPYSTIYAGLTDENVKKFIIDNLDLFNNDENVTYSIVGSTIGTHIGPGALGVAFFEK